MVKRAQFYNLLGRIKAFVFWELDKVKRLAAISMIA